MKYIIKAVAEAVGAAVLVLAILFVFLQSTSGKSLLTSMLSKTLSSEPGLKVEFGRIEGVVPFDIRLDHFRISDVEGTWLDAQNVSLRWSALSFLRGRINIDELHISSLSLDRLSSGGREKKPLTWEFPPRLKQLWSLTISDLSVGDLSLGRSVLGQSAVFGLEVRIRDAGSRLGRALSLQLKRKDHGAHANADVEVVLDEVRAMLSVKAVLQEEEGGLVGAALGLQPGPLHLVVEGDGPTTDWKGKIQGEAGTYGSITAEVDLKAGEETQFALSGKIELARAILSQRLSPIMGGDNYFGLAMNFSPSRFFVVEKGWLRGKGYHFETTAKLDLRYRDLHSDWIFSMHSLPVPDSVGDSPIRRELSAQGSFSGSINRPQGTASVLLRDLRLDGSVAEEIKSDIDIEPLEQDYGFFSGVRLKGTSRAMRFTADAPGNSENVLTWSLGVEAPEAKNLLLLELVAENEKNTLKLSSMLDIAQHSGTLEASLKVENFKSLEAFTGREIPGALALQTHLSAEGADSISGRFQGQISRIPSPGELLSPESSFSGQFNIRGTELDLSEFQIQSLHLEFNNRARVNLSDGQIKGEWQFVLPKLASLGPSAGISLGGSIEASGTYTGAYDALEHAVTIKGNDIVLEGRKLPQFTANIDARKAPKAPQGSIRLEMRRENETLDVLSDFNLQKERLIFSSINMQAPGVKIKGEVGVDLKKTQFQGSFEGSFTDLAAVGRITGERLEGSGNFKIRLSPGKKGLDIQGTLDGNNLATRLGNVKKVALSADLSNVPEIPQGRLNLDLQEYRRAGLLIVKAGLKLSGDGKNVNFEGGGNGQYRETFEFQTRGDLLRAAKASDRLRVRFLGGRFGDRPFKLVEPLILHRSAGKIAFERLSIQYGPGKLTGSGSLDAKRVLLGADFEKFPVNTPAGLNAPALTGSAAGSFRLEGEPSRPSASLDLHISGIRSKTVKAREARSSHLNIEARFAGGRLKLMGELRSLTEQPVRANLETRMTFSLVPFAFSLPPGSPIQGDLEGEADLAFLTTFVPLPDHELTGRAAARFTIQGTMASPELNGTIKIKGGSYQNLPYGTVLKDLDIEMTANGRRLSIEKARATDGGKGFLSASGWVQVDADNSIPMALDVTMVDLALIRRHDAAGVAGGSIKISGSAEKVAVSGQLQVESAEVLLQRRQAPEVVQLNVIEVHGGKTAHDEMQEAEAPPLFNSSLDIRVSLPGNVMVRGRGLDSEWRGELRLSGEGRRQSFTGNLNTVRGTFDFLGKRFKVTNGVIGFHGAFPPAPVLDITAEARARDITARLLLRGPASALDIKFESDPPLPSDEILARVLFNRETNNITPMQALRLAEALRSLSGRGDALDFLGRTREFLGLGQLELRETGREPGLGPPGKEMGADKGIGLGIGRYLTEDIYVDVEKGIGSESGKVSVRIEVTPQITLETEAGLDNSRGIGLHWKRDY